VEEPRKTVRSRSKIAADVVTPVTVGAILRDVNR
jgi:hypothetical protein